jgi:hypothetical protein
MYNSQVAPVPNTFSAATPEEHLNDTPPGPVLFTFHAPITRASIAAHGQHQHGKIQSTQGGTGMQAQPFSPIQTGMPLLSFMRAADPGARSCPSSAGVIAGVWGAMAIDLPHALKPNITTVTTIYTEHYPQTNNFNFQNTPNQPWRPTISPQTPTSPRTHACKPSSHSYAPPAPAPAMRNPLCMKSPSW